MYVCVSVTCVLRIPVGACVNACVMYV